MMLLEQRRGMDVQQQMGALRAEFKNWRNESYPTAELEKHHTQIRRITGILESFLDGLAASGSTVRSNDELLAALLFVQRTWAYFRDMFAMRTVRMLRDPLKCADEFAWECYRPLWERARDVKRLDAGKLKEPPLLFCSTNASPFIQRRNTPFLAEGVTADDMERFDAALAFLPIPVIGVPWSQVNHLPAAVVIGHEVGHAVERDFHVMGVLDTALRNLPAAMGERRRAWQAWRSELFADVFGILCSGPAHLMALSAFLVGPQDSVEQESVNWNKLGDYPTRCLRVAFNVEVLKQLGLSDEGVAASWNSTYPEPAWAEYGDFFRDLPIIATLFLAAPAPALGDVPVAEIMQVTTDEWEIIKAKAQDLAGGVRRDEANRFRRTVAASTWAYYNDPGGYMNNAKNATVSSKLAATILRGVRGPVTRNAAAEVELQAAQTAADQTVAEEMLALAVG